MKKTIVMILVVCIAGAAFGAVRGRKTQETVNYRMVTVEQGDLAAVVSSTGTLDAVTTVQVGTQVSGIIDEILADYNDRVEAGQVIARIDPTLLASAVAAAEAQLARSRAELRQAGAEFERFEELHEKEFVSDSEYNASQYDLDVARASVQSAEVDLARARLNLEYATITSPIDGTVISRSMEVGQTVQASFSAPELFLIAGDLTHMQILATVDESDIGQISEGQTARFTVQAYPDDVFEGTVRQVRLQSSTEENVVSYTAVVDVSNSDGRLLPGMTATVDFVVETAPNALFVSNASLRYKPDDEIVQAAFARLRSERETQAESDSSSPEPAAGPGPDNGGGDVGERGTVESGGERGGSNRGTLWTVDESGELVLIPVRTGISDGSNTAVTGRGLEAGRLVIAGVSRSATPNGSSENGSSTPFQQQSSSDRNGPPSPGGF
ncbi:MAG: efflux RND transporter periplasmic adaptor subunit [Gemmatimonadetes bacterium]|nr:efflux RND transporter periplasmic adaptor subunit [Gemmatimonadota bacterium]